MSDAYGAHVSAIAEFTATVDKLRRIREDERNAVYVCGWCKSFVHWENRGGMFRMIHDETPATQHEVLPLRLSR